MDVDIKPPPARHRTRHSTNLLRMTAVAAAVLAIASRRWLAPASRAGGSAHQHARTRVCLNMIAKNEAHNIERALRSVAPHIAAYTVCDTGSTDGTPAVVARVFRQARVPGHVEHHAWRDFGHNRNLCLNASLPLAQHACDYWLLMDADQELVSSTDAYLGDMQLHSPSYLVQQRQGSLVYSNVRLVSTNASWEYVGSTHEYITATSPNVQGTPHAHLPATVYITQDLDQRGGDRAHKFERDLRLLQQDLASDPHNVRTLFYLANTHKALGNASAAVEYYVQRIAQGGWREDVYMSGLEVAHLLQEALYNETRLHGRAVSSVIKWMGHGDWVDGAQAGGTWENAAVYPPSLETVVHAYEKAAQLLPYRVEAMVHAARLYRRAGRHAACYEAALDASARGPHTQATLFSDDDVVQYGPNEAMCVCGYYTGQTTTQSGGLAACTRLLRKLASLESRSTWHNDLATATLANVEWYIGLHPTGVGTHADLSSTPASAPVEATRDQAAALVDVSTYAYHLGHIDVGARLSELALTRNLTEAQEWTVRNNRPWYTRTLQASGVDAVFVRLDFEPPRSGWTLLNPSLVVTDTGYTACVRSSNYRVRPVPHSFTSEYETLSAEDDIVRTTYSFVRLRPDLTLASAPQHVAGPDYASNGGRVRGLEDAKLNVIASGNGSEPARLVVSGNVRDAVGHDDTAQIMTAMLDADATRMVNATVASNPLLAASHEKNWMTFVGRADTWLYKAYDQGHTKIASVDAATSVVRLRPGGPSPYLARHYRGGSGLVRLPQDGRWLGLVHEVSAGSYGRTYEHRFIALSPVDMSLTAQSAPFFIMQPRTIEYGSSLSVREGDVVIGFGLLDAQAWLARMPLAQVLGMLRDCLGTGESG